MRKQAILQKCERPRMRSTSVHVCTRKEIVTCEDIVLGGSNLEPTCSQAGVSGYGQAMCLHF